MIRVMRWALVVVVVLAGCGERREDAPAGEVRPVGEEQAEGEVQMEPLPGATEAPAGVEATAPTTEPVVDEAVDEGAAAGEGDEGSVTAEDENASQRVAVRVVNATCGENVREAEGQFRASVRRNGSTLRIRLEDLSYYCDPPPRFEAAVEGDAVVVRVLRPEPGRPVARCVCLHDATIVVNEVPASVRTARFVDDDGGAIGSAAVGE